MSLRSLRTAVETWAPGQGIAADPLHRIGDAWSQIVGPSVAQHSEPLELNGTTLLVATRSSAWSQQLQLLSPTILRAVTALPAGIAVTRLAFRSGALRRPARRPGGRGRTPPVSRANRVPETGAPPPAADAAEALARLRSRFAGLRASSSRCSRCGAVTNDGAEFCAPCAGAAESDRAVALQRTLYLAPWLTHAELRESFPGLSGAEFERARRVLLQRWWLVLERVKRAGKPKATPDERQVASSYVLLQSRLPPDRITPEIVRNLLGPDVTDAIWPNRGE